MAPRLGSLSGIPLPSQLRTRFSPSVREETRHVALADAFTPAQSEATQATTAPAALGAANGRPVKREVEFLFDAGARRDLSGIRLVGSWNKAGEPSQEWDTRGIPMRDLGDGLWGAKVTLLDDGTEPTFEWGVYADAPSGKKQWAVMGEGNLSFTLREGVDQVSYAPTTHHLMGVHKVGRDGVSFRFWAPNAKDVVVKVVDAQGKVERFPMERLAESGDWRYASKSGWKGLEGKAYVYEVRTSDDQVVDRADPYARVFQGEQRGVGRFYLDPVSGAEANFYTPGREELYRFEIDDVAGAERAELVLKSPDGKVLNREELLALLGSMDPELISKARKGKFNDLWSQNVEPDGRIQLTRAGNAFSVLVNNPTALEGYRYELRAFGAQTPDGEVPLIDDKNKDGVFSVEERQASSYNDGWTDVLGKGSGQSFRGGIITEPSYKFRHDDAPREKDWRKWVIYQAHVGSLFGKENNVDRSTLEDLIGRLDYIKSLGINALEFLPTNEVEGVRDWGYMGVNTLGIESGFGFEDKDGRWVRGDEAFNRLVDLCHERGINVVVDVVYNHVHGQHNHLWDLDGPENPYFNWAEEPGKMERRDTQWGAVPAYRRPRVKKFFVDHAVAQVVDHHVDGLRFDFTEPIKGTGGRDGWELLREVNRQLQFVKPETFTMAEQFDYDPAITDPIEANGTGGGFSAQWYTQFQHDLVRDSGEPGMVQAAALGGKPNLERFMRMLTHPRGMRNWQHGVAMISNHDEVGNAERTINVADGNSTSRIPPQWARNANRLVMAVGMFGPGVPMFFQGEESMAQNPFRWGVPSTWDIGWDWASQNVGAKPENLLADDAARNEISRLLALSPTERDVDPGYQKLGTEQRAFVQALLTRTPEEREEAMLNLIRRQTYECSKDAIALRRSSPAFLPSAGVYPVHTDSNNSVFAFRREAEQDAFVVVGSLSKQAFSNYKLKLPPGKWREVFNSDAQRFGGSGVGNADAVFSGDAALKIPAGGVLVLERIPETPK